MVTFTPRAAAAFALCAAFQLYAQSPATPRPTPDRGAIATAPIALTGFTLIDGRGGPAVPNAALVLKDGRVAAVGPAARVHVPNDAQRVSLRGKFIIPGLISAHAHVNRPSDLKTFAAYGVTTVFSLGGESPEVLATRAGQASQALDHARLFAAGTVVTAATVQEASAQVDALAKQNVDIVKIRVDDNLGTATKMSPEAYGAVISAAHAKGLRLAAHLFYLNDAKDLLAAGADFLAHSVRDLPVDDALIASLRQRNVCLSPTLMREVSTFVYESTPAFFSDSLFLAHANKEWITTLSEPARQAAMRASPSAQRYKLALEQASQNLKRLSEAGVMIAMGTDAGPTGRFQGYFELMELELMAKAGLTPAQVLAAATRDAARCMKLDSDLGTLEPGKWADFVILNANPLQNISNVRRISTVWIAGHPLSP